jgi:choline dehydrogenase-like flavoprotein
VGFVDSRSVTEGEAVETDVCIIGGGAAGITLAREFQDRDFRVVLLESGGDGFDLETQNLYRGENVGRSYFPLEGCRLRYYGGTTNHWSNWCSTFDPEDFEVRPWIPHSGWPITRASLDPFYERAHVLAGLGPYRYDDLSYWTTPGGGEPLKFRNAALESRTIQIGTPRAVFANKYRAVMQESKNTRVMQWANMTELEFAPDSDRIQRARVKTLAGNEFTVNARVFVLCAGGIENPRLLLASRSSRPDGIGNDRDLVGRFFQEHMNQNLGRFMMSDPEYDFSFYSMKRPLHGTRAHGYIRLSAESRRAAKLPGFRLYFKHTFSEDVAPGIDSTKIVLKSIKEDGVLPDNFSTHLWNIISDFDDVAEQIYRRKTNQPLDGRVYRVTTRVEQEPNPDSRVTLGEELDPLGVPRSKLDWHLTKRDVDAVLRGQQLAATELAREGIGRAKFLEFEASSESNQEIDHLFGGCHHMGTTRMADDPQNGVVDPDCKVFGTRNLFIGGSSVFPTSGQCNPTLTIVALAVRLADRIKGELG